ncbi:hypothetical protein [Aequorivita sp. Q41]|uniref:hypothetical protein n=1 Tax=Aequorivita sp. Q41 TaxID=3153300 RepID=UPI00324289D7
MKMFKITLLLLSIISLTSCASGYKTIQPNTINYLSADVANDIKMEYKYDLLRKKYAKKEVKKGIKLVAIKITNDSDKDVMFGRDVKLTYENGKEIHIVENDLVFTTLKQSSASYLLYLLLTPLNLYTSKTSSNGIEETTSSFPVGLILGPGIAVGNMITASSANANFKSELLVYNINGSVIKAGESKYGLIGIRTDSYDALKIKVE